MGIKGSEILVLIYKAIVSLICVQVCYLTLLFRPYLKACYALVNPNTEHSTNSNYTVKVVVS